MHLEALAFRHRWLLRVLLVFVVCHIIAGVFCVVSGVASAPGDRRKFMDVAVPLRHSGDLTDNGYKILFADLEKRSSVHKTVLFIYAGIHFVTALVLVLAVKHMANLRRELTHSSDPSSLR